MPSAKKLPRANKTGGYQPKTSSKSFGDNGSVVFRTQEEKDEVERLDNMRFVADLIDTTDLTAFTKEQINKIESFRQFRQHENNVISFKRKNG